MKSFIRGLSEALAGRWGKTADEIERDLEAAQRRDVPGDVSVMSVMSEDINRTGKGTVIRPDPWWMSFENPE